jgi:hypothetical protein
MAQTTQTRRLGPFVSSPPWRRLLLLLLLLYLVGGGGSEVDERQNEPNNMLKLRCRNAGLR